jgi:hypothetical protein
MSQISKFCSSPSPTSTLLSFMALVSIVFAGYLRFSFFGLFVLKVLGDAERFFCAKVPVLRGTAKLAPGGLSAPGAK